MTQLTYEEAFDPYHSVYRLFRFSLMFDTSDEMPIDTVRVLDFYLLFPYRIAEIRLRSENIDFRKTCAQYCHLSSYGEEPIAPNLFSRMRPIQLAALDTFCNAGYIESSLLDKGIVAFTKKEIPKNIYLRCLEDNEKQSSLVKMLNVFAFEYKLTGSDGLKDRTKLMEYRYDAA